MRTLPLGDQQVRILDRPAQKGDYVLSPTGRPHEILAIHGRAGSMRVLETRDLVSHWTNAFKPREVSVVAVMDKPLVDQYAVTARAENRKKG